MLKRWLAGWLAGSAEGLSTRCVLLYGKGGHVENECTRLLHRRCKKGVFWGQKTLTASFFEIRKMIHGLLFVRLLGWGGKISFHMTGQILGEYSSGVSLEWRKGVWVAR